MKKPVFTKKLLFEARKSMAPMLEEAKKCWRLVYRGYKRDLLNEYRAIILKDFFSYDNRQVSVKVPYRRYFSMGKYSYAEYNKQIIPLIPKRKVIIKHGVEQKQSAHRVDIITHTNSISKSTSIVWHTSQENTRKALKYGLLRPQALTSKAISEIGKYRIKVIERAIKSGFISKKAKQKDKLIDICQRRIELLEGLERLMNAYISHENVESDEESLNAKDVMKSQLELQIQLYINKVKKYKKTLNRHEANTNKLRELFDHYDKNFLDDLNDDLDGDIRAAQKLQAKINVGNKDRVLLQFIHTRAKSHVMQLQRNNQILAYNGYQPALSRGDLTSYCIDALFAIDNHEPDQHNPMTKRHQYHFEGHVISLDSGLHSNNTHEDLERWMAAITVIEGIDELNIDEATLAGKLLRPSNVTKWRHLKSFFTVTHTQIRLSERVLALLWNEVILGICVAPLNFIEVFLFGHRAGVMSKFMEKISYKPNSEHDKSLAYYGWVSDLQCAHTYFSTRLGLIAHELVVSSIIETLKGGAISLLKSVKLLPKLWYDFKNGWFSVNKTYEKRRGNLTEQLAAELKEIRADRNAIDKALSDRIAEITPDLARAKAKLQFTDDDKRKSKLLRPKNNATEAIPEYLLEPYHSAGLINTVVDSGIDFINLFDHNLYAKFPFASVVFSMTYVAGVSAALAPHFTSAILGKEYVYLSNKLGGAFAKGPGMAITAGFTEAKVTSGLTEGLLNGPESWASKGFTNFIKDPAMTTVYLGLCYGIGYGLTYSLYVPGVTEHLHEEIGSFPPLALTFAGLKVAFALYELLAIHSRSAEQDIDHLRTYIIESYAEIKSESFRRDVHLTKEEKEEINRRLDILLSEGNINDIQNEIPNYLLLINLAFNSEYLKFLSLELKEDLREMLPKITENSTDSRAICKMLQPKKMHSPVKNFLNSIIKYISLSVRCALSPLTGSARPFKELAHQILDDVVCVYYAVHKLVTKVSHMVLMRIPRVISDIIGNEFFARISGMMGSHKATKSNFKTSEHFENLRDGIKFNATARVLRKLTKEATAPVATVGIGRALSKEVKAQIRNEKSIFSVKQFGFYAKNWAGKVKVKVNEKIVEPLKQSSDVALGQMRCASSLRAQRSNPAI